MKKSVKLNLAITGLVLGFSLGCGALDLSSSTREDYSQNQEVLLNEEKQNIYCENVDENQHLMNLVCCAAKASESAYDFLNFNTANHCAIPFGNINGVRSGFVRSTYIDGQPYIVVAIHGTANLDDGITDAKAFSRAKCPFLDNAPVHAGFYERYEAFRDEMINAVKICRGKMVGQNPKILVTGHSLGGALATLAALDLEQMPQFSEKIHMITFCSPRVLTSGAQKIASKILPETKHRALRVWRIGDTVAKVGLGAMGYKHFGESWGIDVAPGEGVSNYVNSLSWHSISTMAKIVEDLKQGKLNFDDCVKINSSYTVLKGAPKRAGKALLGSGKYIKSFFWK